MTLLIVQENAAMRRLLQSLLEGLPFSVHECEDGAQATAVCARVRPDWVLIDLNLSAHDGILVMRQMRAASADTRIVALVEDDNARVREAARRAGACGCLAKENLLEVRRLLEAPP